MLSSKSDWATVKTDGYINLGSLADHTPWEQEAYAAVGGWMHGKFETAGGSTACNDCHTPMSPKCTLNDPTGCAWAMKDYNDETRPRIGCEGIPVAGPASGSCAKGAEWPFGKIVADVMGPMMKYPTDAALSAFLSEHGEASGGRNPGGKCKTECEKCHHDPCYAEVQLGGEYFSCCGMWSAELCTAEEQSKIYSLAESIEEDWDDEPAGW